MQFFNKKRKLIFLIYNKLAFRATINNFSRGVVNQKRFYTRETLGGIMISLLAKITTLYRDWLRSLKYEKG